MISGLDGLDKLKEIGAQKIHEKTHITREHIEAILHNSFDGMNKIQFSGFLSILEREYDVNLSDVKIKGLEYYLNLGGKMPRNSSVFIETRTKTKKTPYIIMALLVVIIVAFFILNERFFENDMEKVQDIDNENIENTKSNILPEPILDTKKEIFNSEENLSTIKIEQTPQDINVSLEKEKIQEKEKVQEKVQPNKQIKLEESTINSFKIIPNKRLWMSYRDLKEDKLYEKTFLGELSLDPKKDWLLNLGHGNTKFELDGENLDFSSVRNMKFLYKNHTLKEISSTEFKQILKDHKW